MTATSTAERYKMHTLVAIGRKLRRRGANNGWQFVEYTRSSGRDPFGELARGQVCYSCHVGARRTDYIFTRLR